METENKERLYNLLPAIYRQQDLAKGEPLRALFGVIQREFNTIEQDIDGLYDNWFVETCEEWVLPYLGELYGIKIPEEEGSVPHDMRAMIANILYYRRRKGTAKVLERVIRDATGWRTRVVEFKRLVAITQHLKYPRPEQGKTFSVTQTKDIALVGTPFESGLSHTIDVRRPESGGRYNINNLGLYVWRLKNYAMNRIQARSVNSPSDGRYTFHPLGHDTQLFNLPATEENNVTLLEEYHVPGPIRPAAFEADLKEQEQQADHTRYYGPGRGFNIMKTFIIEGEKTIVSVPPNELIQMDLSDWKRPRAGKIAVDVKRGRIAFALEDLDTITGPILVSYSYGFAAAIGGGPYTRKSSIVESETPPWEISVTVDGTPIGDENTTVDPLSEALEAWNTYSSNTEQAQGIIRIKDSGIYQEAITISLPKESFLRIEAADGTRPCLILQGDLRINSSPEGGGLSLNGLLIQGRIQIPGGNNVGLLIEHCTITPSDSENEVSKNEVIMASNESTALELTIKKSILGAVRYPSITRRMIIEDSIIDSFVKGTEPGFAISSGDSNDSGPPLTIHRSTVFGKVHVRDLILASNVIFTASVISERRQTGLIRYSFVPEEGSSTPRQYRCQPQTLLYEERDEEQKALLRDRLKPIFSSRSYGNAGYGQLRAEIHNAILAGGEDEGEMGVFHALKQNQRKKRLKEILDEYLPFGVDAGVFYVT